MIDSQLVPIQSRILQPLGRSLVSKGISADQLSWAGFSIGFFAFSMLALGYYWLAGILILFNRLCDGLDGVVARQTTPTDRGAYLDIALDFMFYALIPLGFALAIPEQNALAAAFLLTSFIGTASSFLSFAIIAEKRGQKSLSFPNKGFYYLGGLTEGFETILCFLLMILFPAKFPLIASIFAVACYITTAMRWHYAWSTFNTDETDNL